MSYPFRILIVEDHILQQQYMLDVLLQAGFDVAEAVEGGVKALEQLKENEFDLILLDLDMPDMDGMQFIQALAQRQPMVALAICSACMPDIMESAVRVARGQNLTVLGHYAKPFIDEYAHELAHKLQVAQHGRETILKERPIVLSPNQSALQLALREKQIIPWYQPKQCLRTGAIVGVEALARWQHPHSGMISPALFLPYVSLHGLDKPLLTHIFRLAAQDYQDWCRNGYTVPISINLPTHLLEQESLPDELLEVAMHYHIDAQDITFELLETTLTEQTSQLLVGAGRLRLKGFQLAQDDFGIGYSSMQALTTVPFTELKIDRMFVAGAAQDETRAAAMRSSIALGKQLGLKVTAEGVETEEDARLLHTTECDNIQGYYVSHPLPADELLRFLQRA